MTFDSATGFYYTGSGYYDPATGQSFGCQDVGWVDPGEDGCGEDESALSSSSVAGATPSSGPFTPFGTGVSRGGCHYNFHADLYGKVIVAYGNVRCTPGVTVENVSIGIRRGYAYPLGLAYVLGRFWWPTKFYFAGKSEGGYAVVAPHHYGPLGKGVYKVTISFCESDQSLYIEPACYVFYSPTTYSIP